MGMAIKIQTGKGESTRGVRPVDPTRDLPAIVELIALGFANELDPEGQKILAEMRQSVYGRSFRSWMTNNDYVPAGFVWVENGEVVGNLSLRSALPGESLGQMIGNVVVHPDYRGRGIGRALVEAAITAAQRQGYRWIGLEVRENNPVAFHMYSRLGFEAVGKQQHLLRPAELPWPPDEAVSLPWRVSKPRDRLLWLQLACAIYPRRQQLVLEIRPSHYVFGGFERRLNRWFEGEREEAWLYGDQEARLALRINTDRRYHFHNWEILVHPAEDTLGAQAVVVKALQATRRFPPWPVIALVADQQPLLEALFNVGFQVHRTLVQMILEC